jgi:hypothetical protein
MWYRDESRPTFSRPIIACVLPVLVLLGLWGWVWAPSVVETAESSEAADSAELGQDATSASGRLREGTRLAGQIGYFKPAGDRLIFQAVDGTHRMRVLENLSLERIARRVGDSPERLEWVISGEVSEFQGANYLLVTQAILKTRPVSDGP